jgi:hypothetical protein
MVEIGALVWLVLALALLNFLSKSLHDYGAYLTSCIPKYIQQFSVSPKENPPDQGRAPQTKGKKLTMKRT